MRSAPDHQNMSSSPIFVRLWFLFLVFGLPTALCDVAVDLNATSFNGALKESPASFAVVEFFAHWGPACRNYKPHYEKVARLFNGPDAVHPRLVFMARVDCAMKINIQLCDQFSISHYPVLLWGQPSKFTAGGSEPKEDKNGITPVDDGRTAERLLNWINKQLGSSFSLDDEKEKNENHLQNALVSFWKGRQWLQLWSKWN